MQDKTYAEVVILRLPGGILECFARCHGASGIDLITLEEADLTAKRDLDMHANGVVTTDNATSSIRKAS
jgi:hypothetical protein